MSTQNDTIDSVIETLPTVGMTEEAKTLGLLTKDVRKMISDRGNKLSKALKCLKAFQESCNELQTNVLNHLDYLTEYKNCYGMVPIVEDILVTHEVSSNFSNS